MAFKASVILRDLVWRRNFTMAVWCRSPAKSANRRCGYPDTLFGDCSRVTGKPEGILKLAPMVQFTQGRDLKLAPAQEGAPLNYFVYPYVEIGGKEYPNVSIAFSFEDVGEKVANALR